MNERRIVLLTGVGCALLILLTICALPVMFLAYTQISYAVTGPERAPAVEARPVTEAPAEGRTVPDEPRANTPAPQLPSVSQLPGISSDFLAELYRQVNPGVVNVEVLISRGDAEGQGAGSGFIFDAAGHIVTNNHVVADADRVLVVFYNGIETEAEVVGTDADSDLAVLRVEEFADGAHPLRLADSNQVQAGEWVVAIGNPFQFGGSMMIGIVSAVGRTIPSGLTPFSIPQAIQTDAAINPGNSGGPLLNMAGEVIGVNAQIARNGGARANSGVGFAIPSNVVRLVVPALIEKGVYEWPWLGVRGTAVNLAIQQANDLPTQHGAYITDVIPDAPAAAAGLQGSSRTVDVNGFQAFVGGDVIIEVDGVPINDFNDLLVEVAFRKPHDRMQLTILRDGKRQQITVILAPRPADFGS